MTLSNEVATIRAAIEHAPPATPSADGLLGWRTPEGNCVCSACASRIMGRGCRLPEGSTPVWDDMPFGECVTH